MRGKVKRPPKQCIAVGITPAYAGKRINLYNQYDKKTSDLIKEYNNKFEPLTLTGNELKEVPWAWEDSPWPWEGV